MRILSARAREVFHDRNTHRVSATIVLRLERNGIEHEILVRTNAPVSAPGAASLKERLIASAKLRLALADPMAEIAGEEPARPAA